MWKAFDLVDLARVLSGEKLIFENGAGNGQGFIGNGIYFYDSVQKAIETTLTYQILKRRELLEQSLNLSKSQSKYDVHKQMKLFENFKVLHVYILM